MATTRPGRPAPPAPTPLSQLSRASLESVAQEIDDLIKLEHDAANNSDRIRYLVRRYNAVLVELDYRDGEADRIAPPVVVYSNDPGNDNPGRFRLVYFPGERKYQVVTSRPIAGGHREEVALFGFDAALVTR